MTDNDEPMTLATLDEIRAQFAARSAQQRRDMHLQLDAMLDLADQRQAAQFDALAATLAGERMQ